MTFQISRHRRRTAHPFLQKGWGTLVALLRGELRKWHPLLVRRRQAESFGEFSVPPALNFRFSPDSLSTQLGFNVGPSLHLTISIDPALTVTRVGMTGGDFHVDNQTGLAHKSCANRGEHANDALGSSSYCRVICFGRLVVVGSCSGRQAVTSDMGLGFRGSRAPIGEHIVTTLSGCAVSPFPTS